MATTTAPVFDPNAAYAPAASSAAPSSAAPAFDPNAAYAPADQTPPTSTAPAPGTTGVLGFINKVGEGAAEAAHDVYGVAKGMVPGGPAETGALKTIWNSLPPVQLADSVKQTLPLIHAYETARSNGASMSDALTAVNEAAKQHTSNISQIKPVVDAFRANPTRETARALIDATAAATSMLVGGEAIAPEAEAAVAAPEAEAVGSPSWLQRMNPFKAKLAATAPEPSDPGFIQKVFQGEQVAQAPAQAATRAAAKAGGAEVGLSTVQPAGLRTLAEEPINIVNGLKKTLYGQVDAAAGTDLKALYDRADKISDQIDLTAPGSAEESKLEDARTSLMQTIEDAKTAARAKGVNVDQTLAKADALHTREMALRDVQKGFLKNVNIVGGNTALGTPETVNVDSAVKVLQKLQDNTKYGAPRLEQAFGKDGAQKLLQDMSAAQRLGVKAVNTQKIAGWIAGLIGVPAVGTATVEIARKVLE